MKKSNLLSKAEMKKVNGGGVPPGCNNDNQCPSGQWCCPDLSDGVNVLFTCLTPIDQQLPGSTETVKICP